MAIRKYQMYLIQIDYPNGSYDTIEYTKDYLKLDKTSYKQMLEVYRETKGEYENTRCTIRFIGISEDEQVEIFSKEFEPQEVEQNSSIRDDIDVVIEQLDILIKKGEDAKSKKENYNIIVRDIYHKEIEFSEDNSESHKVRVFDKLKDIFIKRRQIDTDLKLYNQYIDKFNLIKDTVMDIQQARNGMENKTKQIIEEFKDTGDMSCGNGRRVYYYNNFKERMNLMKQLTPKYVKIENDETNKCLICKKLK